MTGDRESEAALDPIDALHLRAAITLSAQARDAGNMPYGALLVGADGRVLHEARNTQISARDCTGHAETNLIREASARLDPASLAGSTVYASGEPCAMCAGALYWGGVRRLVYALSIASMCELGGAEVDELSLACRGVMAHGTRRVEVTGPALQAEARRVFEAREDGTDFRPAAAS